jgi:hypothetical protein
MNPCTPLQLPIQRVAPPVLARPRHVVHYAVSHKTHAAAGHHATTGHPVAHLPLGHHPRRVWHHRHHHVHHAPPVPVDSGACGVSDITRKLHTSGGGMMGGSPASSIAIGGLTAGGVAAGIGAGAALAQGGSPWSNGGAGGPGFGTPGLGGSGAGGPGFGGPGFGGPGGGTGPGGGGPQAPLPGTPLVSHATTPPAPVSVPEPSSLLVLAAALLALALTRWTIARR